MPLAPVQRIDFGESKSCSLKLEEGSAGPGADPELTVSRYPVEGLSQGELSIVVTRTALPAIVKVEASERGTGLSAGEIEQIRAGAEGIFRGKFG